MGNPKRKTFIVILAVDTETTGTDFWHGCRAFMVSACDGENSYVWSAKVDPYDRSKVTWNPKDLKEIQKLLDSAKRLVFHNTKFDMRALEFAGLETDAWWGKIDDTIIAHHCLASGDKHSLKYLAFKYLGWYNDDEKDLGREVQAARAKNKDYDIAKEGHPCFPGVKGQKISWWKMDYWLCMEEVLKYATSDVEMTWVLHNTFQEALKSNGLLEQYKLRCKLLLIAYEMENAGLSLDVDQTFQEIETLKLKSEHLRKKIETLCNYKYRWDPSDTKDLYNFLHIKLGLPVVFETETGRPSLNKTAIEYYIESNPDKPALKLYSTLKRTSSQISYLESYTRWINQKTNRIHSSVWITGTRETRQSTSDPNTQNIDKKLRHIFQPPPGYSWLELDMVNIEMRIWAYMVGNKELIEVFETTGSVHLLIGSIIYPELYNELGPIQFKQTQQYDWVKGGNFAIIYGATEYTADKTYKKFGSYKKISSRFPEVPKFSQRCADEAEKNYKWYNSPYVTTHGGYNLDVPLDNIYKAANYKVQGSAGWIMLESMIEVDRNQDFMNAGCRIVQQVHDSLTIEVKTSKLNDDLIASIVKSMEAPGLKYMPTSKVSFTVRHSKDVEVPF